MSKLLTDEDWDVLLRRIKQGRCTPFLGAGASYGVLPLGGDIAKQWAEKYEYPMEDRSNLIAVSQFLALKYSDSVFPKDLIVDMFEGAGEPDFNDPTEPHRVLANVNLPVYVTTNYDDFMVKALMRHLRTTSSCHTRGTPVRDFATCTAGAATQPCGVPGTARCG